MNQFVDAAPAPRYDDGKVGKEEDGEVKEDEVDIGKPPTPRLPPLTPLLPPPRIPPPAPPLTPRTPRAKEAPVVEAKYWSSSLSSKLPTFPMTTSGDKSGISATRGAKSTEEGAGALEEEEVEEELEEDVDETGMDGAEDEDEAEDEFFNGEEEEEEDWRLHDEEEEEGLSLATPLGVDGGVNGDPQLPAPPTLGTPASKGLTSLTGSEVGEGICC